VATIVSNEAIIEGGKVVFGQQFPWGFVRVDRQQHSDLLLLQQLLFQTHHHELVAVTQKV
jgi:septin family protein